MSKLNSARLLILGMEGLRPSAYIPVSNAALKAAKTPNDALDQQRIGTALTCAVLYSIVIELVLKHIWEQEQGQTAPHIHDVYSLFIQLRSEIRRDVKALYNNCCLEYKCAINKGYEQQSAEMGATEMANFEEALRWNEEAVKHLKYEMIPRGKIVPTGIIWSSETVWVVPGTFPNFAIQLTRWAVDRNL